MNESQVKKLSSVGNICRYISRQVKMSVSGLVKWCSRLFIDNALISNRLVKLKHVSPYFSTQVALQLPRRRLPSSSMVDPETDSSPDMTGGGNRRKRIRGDNKDLSSEPQDFEDGFIATNFMAEPVTRSSTGERRSRTRTDVAVGELHAPRLQTQSSVHDEVQEASLQLPASREDKQPSRPVSISDINFLLESNQKAIDSGQDLPPAPPAIDPKKLTVFLFPGQGSQFVGMGQKLLSYPNVQQLFDVASDILGYDLLNVCLNGPRDELGQTSVSQLAIYVCSIAALERIKAEHPEAIENCYTCAGFSVGEYAALTFAGALEFEDCVRIIQVRAEAMQQASMQNAGGLLTVKLSHRSNLNLIMDFARRHCAEKLQIYNPVCQIAGYLFADCKLIGGHEEAIQFIEQNAADFHVVPLKRVPVSGAFHTHMMWKAQSELQMALGKIEVRRPNIPVISNCSASVYQHGEQIKRHLVKQLVKPIKWEQSMLFVFRRPEEVPMPHVYEVGPGRHLYTMLKNLGSVKDQGAVKNYHSVDV